MTTHATGITHRRRIFRPDTFRPFCDCDWQANWTTDYEAAVLATKHHAERCHPWSRA